jgi:orotidine-5'-phosphate decarboxylase
MEEFSKNSVIVALDQYHNRFHLCDIVSMILSNYNEDVAGIKLEKAFFEYGRSIVYDIKDALVSNRNKLLMLDLKLNSIPETNVGIFKLYEEVADFITVRSKTLSDFYNFVDMKKVCWVPYLSSEKDNSCIDMLNISHQVLTFIPGYIVLSPSIMKNWDIKTLFKLNSTKILTPGIRYGLSKNKKDGHAETLTPEEAYQRGVDYLIMGRSFYSQ